MSDQMFESGEEEIDEEGNNPTQRRMGSGEDAPSDVSWDEAEFGATPDEIDDDLAEELEGEETL